MKNKKLVFTIILCGGLLVGCTNENNNLVNNSTVMKEDISIQSEVASETEATYNENASDEAEVKSIELASITTTSNVIDFKGMLDNEGKKYICDSFFMYEVLSDKLPIDKDYHNNLLNLSSVNSCSIEDMLIKDDYIYYTINDRSQEYDCPAKLQLWKTPLDGGEPTLLKEDVAQGHRFMIDDKIFLEEFGTGRGLFITIDGIEVSNIPQISDDGYYADASNDRLFYIDTRNRIIISLDYNGNEIQRFLMPEDKYYGLVKYKGAIILTMQGEDFESYLIPNDGYELVKIKDMSDKGLIYDFAEDGNICFYNCKDMHSDKIVEISSEEKLECIRHLGDMLIYETSHQLDDYVQNNVYTFDLKTKENKKVSEYCNVE